MARPFKQGLQYFPMDVDLFDDEKIQELNFRYGPLAEIVYIRILTMVYANGYYLEMDIETLAMILLRRMGHNWVKLEKVREWIHACLEVGLFDKDLSVQGVITSVPIQKQFILSTKRRKNVNIDKYWLLDRTTMFNLKVFLSTSEKGVIVNNNIDNVDNNSINVNINQQKEKENKKDKKDKIDKKVYGEPKLHFLTKSIIKHKYIEDTSLDIIKYNQLFEEVVSEYGFEKTLIGVKYITKYAKRARPPIVHKFAFMRDSLLSNLEKFRKWDEKKNEQSFDTWMEQVLFSVGKKG
jgi:Domain of unknown function (DUF4373)